MMCDARCMKRKKWHLTFVISRDFGLWTLHFGRVSSACIGSVKPSGISRAGVSELPCTTGIGDVGGDILPQDWRQQIRSELNNIRGVRAAQEKERHAPVRVRNDIRDERRRRRNWQTEHGAGRSRPAAKCGAVQ